MAAEGLTTIQSSSGPRETMKRLEAAVKAKGLTVFAHIDHAAGAAEVGLALRPTELLIFATPEVVRHSCKPRRRSESICRSRPWSGRMQWATHGFPTMTQGGLRDGMGWTPKSRQRSAMAAALNAVARAATTFP
jgi:hypothetical protein